MPFAALQPFPSAPSLQCVTRNCIKCAADVKICTECDAGEMGFRGAAAAQLPSLQRGHAPALRPGRWHRPHTCCASCCSAWLLTVSLFPAAAYATWQVLQSYCRAPPLAGHHPQTAGYYLSPQKTCVRCKGDCGLCNPSNPAQCTDCFLGYGLVTATKKCVKVGGPGPWAWHTGSTAGRRALGARVPASWQGLLLASMPAHLVTVHLAGCHSHSDSLGQGCALMRCRTRTQF